jgi:hypothetical protein
MDIAAPTQLGRLFYCAAFAKLQDAPEKLFDLLFAFAMEPLGTGCNNPTRAKSVQSILFRQSIVY